jgi:osmoprotectant transport system substrate-binding protein
MFRKSKNIAAIATMAALLLAACGSSDSISEESSEPSAESIVVGSQAYYSNEIIAEIYAQALESEGFEVERQFNIGQRDAYLPSLESGEVQVFPEYTGNLLQFYDPETAARTPDDVYAGLQSALPDTLAVLEPSPASDQDSYTVTAAFAEKYDLTTIADLANVTEPLTLGGPPELAERPYGPKGLKKTYGIDVKFEATGDTTADDLVAGTVNVANIFTASERIQTDDLVVLEDPEGLFLASNVVPLVSSDLAEEIADVINPISAALTPEELVALNVKSSIDQESAEDIAAAWLTENGLDK